MNARDIFSRQNLGQRAFPSPSSQRSGPGKTRLILALVVAGIALFSFFNSKSFNPVTGEDQYVSITPEQEIALGLQAAPSMAQEYGGLLQDEQAQALVTRIGKTVVRRSPAGQSGYPFEFHVLADPQTVNAFALPGGQVFITAALLSRLETEGQIAGVLGHEVGHVVGRHGAEHLAKEELTQGLTGSVLLATFDPDNPGSYGTAQMAVIVGSLINRKYGREDELESDRLGVRFMADAGYDPRGMIRVMEILNDASGGGRPAEFFSTHPNPENRVAAINDAIASRYPEGVPAGLTP